MHPEHYHETARHYAHEVSDSDDSDYIENPYAFEMDWKSHHPHHEDAHHFAHHEDHFQEHFLAQPQ